MKRRIFVDMDGTLAEWRNIEDTEVLYEKGYYESLKPNEFLLQEIKKLIRKGEDIYILSSFLDDSKYALEEKKIWLKKYLPELPDEKKIFVKYGDNKTAYIPDSINSYDYLIDDYTKNLLEWREVGGTGIKFLNGINHTKGVWNGLLLRENESLSANLKDILEATFMPEKDFNKKYKELISELFNTIEDLKSAYNQGEEQQMKVEQKLNTIKDKIKEEKKFLKENFIIETLGTWSDGVDLAVNYSIKDKNGNLLYQGYDYIDSDDDCKYTENPEQMIDAILEFDVRDKIDIMDVSSEIKRFVDDILADDFNSNVTYYDEDLIDMWDITEEEFQEKIQKLEDEIKQYGLGNLLYVSHSGILDERFKSLEISQQIISRFDFSSEYKNKNQSKKVHYEINGKQIECEIKYDERLHGYGVIGYTVDNENQNPDKIQQVLSKFELAQVQGLLLNEVNNLFNEQFKVNEDNDLDITDDMY